MSNRRQIHDYLVGLNLASQLHSYLNSVYSTSLSKTESFGLQFEIPGKDGTKHRVVWPDTIGLGCLSHTDAQDIRDSLLDELNHPYSITVINLIK